MNWADMANSKAAPNKVKLTDWGIQSLKPNPNGKRYMVWDTAMQHRAVRVDRERHQILCRGGLESRTEAPPTYPNIPYFVGSDVGDPGQPDHDKAQHKIPYEEFWLGRMTLLLMSIRLFRQRALTYRRDVHLPRHHRRSSP